MPNTATQRTAKTKPVAAQNGSTARKTNSQSNTKTGAEKGNGMNPRGGRATSPSTSKNRLSATSTSQLEKFFHDQVKDLYWAEKHLTKALPKMQKAATTEELKSAIQDHTLQTKEHVTRLEQVFEMLGKKPQAKKCDAMEGLVKEGETAVEETQQGSMTRDVAIIMASQKVEHYEIASYGTLVQLAETMGNTDMAAILQTTLDEEKHTDENLTSLATNNINWAAESEEEDEKEEEPEA
jgi:ferritin-like metal-binding protein YciE